MKTCVPMLFGLATVISLTAAQRADAQQAVVPRETVVVTAPSAPVMRGNDLLGTVRAGQQLSVINRQNGWLGTNISVNGQVVSGWVWSGNVASPADPVYRRFSYQPEPAVPSQSMMPAQVAPAPMMRSFAAPRSSGSGSSRPTYMLPKTDPNRFRVR